MLPYILTAVAGLLCGIVLMRLFQSRGIAGGPVATEPPKIGQATSPRPARLILIASAVIALIAIGVAVSRKDAGKTPSAGTLTSAALQSAGGQSLDDVDTMITRLEDRLQSSPNDGEGFRMLGWSYFSTGKPSKALAPYKRAIELLPNRADVHAGYGEALTGVANGTVTAEAKRAFDKAVSLNSREPRARFFLSLYKAQNGQEKAALDEWIALCNDGPADAPWQTDVRSRIRLLAIKLGADVGDRLAPLSSTASVAAASAPAIAPGAVESASMLPADQQRSMIDGMVEGLAAKLENDQHHAEGWARLLRSRMVLGQRDQAGRDLVTARKALVGDSKGLALVNAAARENGVPGS